MTRKKRRVLNHTSDHSNPKTPPVKGNDGDNQKHKKKKEKNDKKNNTDHDDHPKKHKDTTNTATTSITKNKQLSSSLNTNNDTIERIYIGGIDPARINVSEMVERIKSIPGVDIVSIVDGKSSHGNDNNEHDSCSSSDDDSIVGQHSDYSERISTAMMTGRLEKRTFFHVEARRRTGTNEDGDGKEQQSARDIIASKYHNVRWRGCRLRVEYAKPSFLMQLKIDIQERNKQQQEDEEKEEKILPTQELECHDNNNKEEKEVKNAEVSSEKEEPTTTTSNLPRRLRVKKRHGEEAHYVDTKPRKLVLDPTKLDPMDNHDDENGTSESTKEKNRALSKMFKRQKLMTIQKQSDLVNGRKHTTRAIHIVFDSDCERIGNDDDDDDDSSEDGSDGSSEGKKETGYVWSDDDASSVDDDNLVKNVNSNKEVSSQLFPDLDYTDGTTTKKQDEEKDKKPVKKLSIMQRYDPANEQMAKKFEITTDHSSAIRTNTNEEVQTDKKEEGNDESSDAENSSSSKSDSNEDHAGNHDHPKDMPSKENNTIMSEPGIDKDGDSDDDTNNKDQVKIGEEGNSSSSSSSSSNSDDDRPSNESNEAAESISERSKDIDKHKDNNKGVDIDSNTTTDSTVDIVAMTNKATQQNVTTAASDVGLAPKHDASGNSSAYDASADTVPHKDNAPLCQNEEEEEDDDSHKHDNDDTSVSSSSTPPPSSIKTDNNGNNEQQESDSISSETEQNKNSKHYNHAAGDDEHSSSSIHSPSISSNTNSKPQNSSNTPQEVDSDTEDARKDHKQDDALNNDDDDDSSYSSSSVPSETYSDDGSSESGDSRSTKSASDGYIWSDDDDDDDSSSISVVKRKRSTTPITTSMDEFSSAVIDFDDDNDDDDENVYTVEYPNERDLDIHEDIDSNLNILSQLFPDMSTTAKAAIDEKDSQSSQKKQQVAMQRFDPTSVQSVKQFQVPKKKDESEQVTNTEKEQEGDKESDSGESDNEEEQKEDHNEKDDTTTTPPPPDASTPLFSKEQLAQSQEQDHVYEQDKLEKVFQDQRSSSTTMASASGAGFGFGFEFQEDNNKTTIQNTSVVPQSAGMDGGGFSFGFAIEEDKEKPISRQDKTNPPLLTEDAAAAPIPFSSAADHDAQEKQNEEEDVVTFEMPRRKGMLFPKQSLEHLETIFFAMNDGPEKQQQQRAQGGDNQEDDWMEERKVLTLDWKRKHKRETKARQQKRHGY